MDDVVVIHIPLKVDSEKVFDLISNKPDLVKKISEKSRTLANKDIETFEQRCNIIVTEKGFYVALESRNAYKAVDLKPQLD